MRYVYTHVQQLPGVWHPAHPPGLHSSMPWQPSIGSSDNKRYTDEIQSARNETARVWWRTSCSVSHTMFMQQVLAYCGSELSAWPFLWQTCMRQTQHNTQAQDMVNRKAWRFTPVQHYLPQYALMHLSRTEANWGAYEWTLALSNPAAKLRFIATTLGKQTFW